MKQFITTAASIIFSFFLLYIPLCFSALSFNPLEWNHTERFLFAIFIWLIIAVYLLKKFIPKPILKV